ncbi:MAG TPA: hypothetical protein VLF18_11145 [Tahibacter sp.]|uniref:hypothetical protein n=1 Tax=Tahibacter sp. TaxID=2056211 RepID=UPI002B60C91E|nr:hypothetical protein [Tahibacter sp.]HSX60744.1 hypothetical protein [Tahibacter sp.]
MPFDRCYRAAALALFTESPEARQRHSALPLHPNEQIAVSLLTVLDLLERSLLRDDKFAAAEHLAVVRAEDLQDFDAALAAVDTRWRQPLGIVARVLLRDLDPASHEMRVLQIVDRGERYGRLASRLLQWNGDILEDLEAALTNYLNRAGAPGWARPDRLPMVHARASESVTTCSASGNGVLHVILERHADALTPVLDDWLGSRRDAMLVSKGDSRPLATIAEAARKGSWFHGMPKDMVIGAPLSGRAAQPPSFSALLGLSLDAELVAIADAFDWALFAWPNTMQESVLAFVSRNAVLANDWDSALRRHRRTSERIAAYHGVDALHRVAHGAQFGESDGYGAAAMIAAAEDGLPPWLIVDVSGNGHTWRRHTARLGIGAVATHTRGVPSFVGVYRADDREAYDALWQRLDHDDGIAAATVCGRAKASVVLDAFLAAVDNRGFHHCNALSRRLGWIYTHVHGGGSGEHHAMFHARDAQTTARVFEFASTRRGWYLSGRW